MKVVRVLLWEANPHTREDLRRLFALCDELRLVGDCESARECREILRKERPDVLLFSLSPGEVESLDELFAGDAARPTLVMLANPRDRRAWREAMARGVKHFLAVPFSADEVVELVLAAHGASRRQAFLDEGAVEGDRPRGRVVSLFSGKGGVGKSSTLVNLACTASRKGWSVAVADVDLPFGDVGAMMGLKPRRNLSDLLRELPPWTSELVNEHCCRSDEGVTVLPGVAAPEHAETVEPWQVEALVAALAMRHDLVLVDSSAGFGPIERAVLGASDRILLLASPEISTVKNVGFCIRELNRMGLGEERFSLVVNRGHPPTGGLEPETIADELGCPLDLVLPSGGRHIVESVNRGEPYMRKNRRCAYGKAMRDLVALVEDRELSLIRRPT